MPETKSNQASQPNPNPGNLDINQLQDFMKAMREQDMAMMTQLISAAVSQAVTTAIAEYKKPTPEEAAAAEADRQRILNQRLRAAEDGKRVDEILKAQQAACSHRKPNGEHKFRGQVNSDGWAVIRCQECLLEFRVRPLPQHVAQGLNLADVPGLTVEHLKVWEYNSASIDEQLKRQAEQERDMTRAFAGVDVTKPLSEKPEETKQAGTRYDSIQQEAARVRREREAQPVR